MNRDIIIGALVGLGLLTGTVTTAGVINNSRADSGYSVKAQKAASEQTKPVIQTKRETETVSIPFETEYRNDSTLEKGSTRVVQEGKNGTRTIVYEVTYKDGTEASRIEVSNTVTSEPVAKIVANGTYVKPQVQTTCPNGSYANAYGNTVCRPSTTNAGGATAICRDGTYSYSQSRRGTCSHHGGVRAWL